MKYPDPSDYVATQNLEDTLRSYDYFESSEELSHRVQVMAKLNVLVREWIRTVSLAKNVPPEIADSVGGRVHTFGSYRLGVHSKGMIYTHKYDLNRKIFQSELFSIST
jgi:poly(A) polymerase